MYNHYIPQSDGSYRRSTVPEAQRRTQQRPQPPPQKQKPRPEPEGCSQPRPEPEQPAPPKCEQPDHGPPQQEPCGGEGILSFLRGLLPREIDTADLLVIFLILLMNRDSGSDGMSPLLTLALYFLL